MNLVNTKRDIINAKALKTAVSVNSTNLASGIIYKHKELVYNSSNWHKFIVTGIKLRFHGQFKLI